MSQEMFMIEELVKELALRLMDERGVLNEGSAGRCV